jgi:sulfur relay (sulfurtransferase) DsrF/TusC family protein
MSKKILSVLSHTEYGNLEDSDIGLFASAFAPVAGSSMTILLAEDAVNYGVRGQHGTGITIAGAPVQPGFLIETDVQSVQQSGIPVYALREDLEERGLSQDELVPGIKLLGRSELGRFIDQFDTVWNW